VISILLKHEQMFCLYHWITDLDSDPEPTLFFNGLQDSCKK
jgi:hypothetical protein